MRPSATRRRRHQVHVRGDSRHATRGPGAATTSSPIGSDGEWPAGPVTASDGPFKPAIWSIGTMQPPLALRMPRGARAADDHLPYFLNIGNHDGATCYGGRPATGVCVADGPHDAHLRRRYSVADYGARPRLRAGQGRPFAIQGRQQVLGDHQPRTVAPQRVVEWAHQLVATHPKDNVIIATHSFLSSKGTISSSAEYGSTSPRYLWDTIIEVQEREVRAVWHTPARNATRCSQVRRQQDLRVSPPVPLQDHQPGAHGRDQQRRQDDRTWMEAPYTKNAAQHQPVTYSKVAFA